MFRHFTLTNRKRVVVFCLYKIFCLTDNYWFLYKQHKGMNSLEINIFVDVCLCCKVESWSSFPVTGVRTKVRD
jgi:hypothetical protein